jgi:hypothetical protein
MTQRERRLAAVTGGAIAVAGFVWGLVDPQLTRQAALSEEVARKQSLLSEMRQNMLLKDRIERRYEQLQTMIRRPNDQEEELATFTKVLSSLQAGQGMQVGSLRILPPIEEGNYVRLLARLEMKGPIGNAMGLLDALSRASEPLRAERVELACRQQVDVVDVSLEISHIASPAAKRMPPTASKNRSARRSGETR